MCYLNIFNVNLMELFSLLIFLTHAPLIRGGNHKNKIGLIISPFKKRGSEVCFFNILFTTFYMQNCTKINYVLLFHHC